MEMYQKRASGFLRRLSYHHTILTFRPSAFPTGPVFWAKKSLMSLSRQMRELPLKNSALLQATNI